MSNFVASDSEEDVYCSDDLGYVDLNLVEVDLACATPVKRRLRERLAFWKSIGASRWVLDVLSDGYSLPFISLPQRAFFWNHHSLSKLLVSSAIAEVSREDLLGSATPWVLLGTLQPRLA